ncbi:competence protein ComK [Sporosarcina sp. YIM B06819]|uniref:competence protein ComK n=1 Tax=Sporosarcina sp. YIM B06819 TaxID=3081769 RepID=UPI00298D3D51|nr:competence protein ComK [Sporosarcina sp. YIM B06819]
MLHCDSYLIDTRTLALESVFTGDYKSKIITTHGNYFSKLSPHQLLNKACLYHFSTMKGRIQAATILLNYDKKPPFLIAPNELGVCPTASPQNADCVWLFNHRYTVTEVGKGQSIVTFMEGTSIYVKASRHTILKQQLRLHALLNISSLMGREKKIYIVKKEEMMI